MKMTMTEFKLGQLSNKLVGFLVIKWHNARATGDTALANEIIAELNANGVKILENPKSVTWVIPDTTIRGGIIPPQKEPKVECEPRAVDSSNVPEVQADDATDTPSADLRSLGAVDI